MKKVTPFKFQEILSVPPTIDLTLSQNFLTIRGPLGQVEVNLFQHDSKGLFYIHIQGSQEKKQLFLVTKGRQSQLSLKAFSNLILDYFEGVTKGFLIHLDVVGIGYRVQQKDNLLELRVGYSHPIEYIVPRDVKVFTPKPTHICLFSIDKQRVTQVAAELRQCKVPEVYKGKGIRYKNESIRKKEGKKK